MLAGIIVNRWLEPNQFQSRALKFIRNDFGINYNLWVSSHNNGNNTDSQFTVAEKM